MPFILVRHKKTSFLKESMVALPKLTSFFSQDNAIPIDGWTSDPTDNDLLYLIPFLEGLQYVTDVRALLGLRLGQPETV